jgi:DNA-binding NarL/FixJ family response regulator
MRGAAVASGSFDGRVFTEPLRLHRGAMKPQTGIAALSPRERQVIESWIERGVHKLVAHDLGITEQTVKNYVTSIIGKLGAASFGQAAVRYDRWAREHPRSFESDRRSGQDRRQFARRRPQ